MENYVIYGKTKYKAIEMVCENCGKTYLAPIRWLKTRKHHYCCQKCAAEGYGKLRLLEGQAKWESEPHYCECCGKLMTTKYGSGRFCSIVCANSRSYSLETKQKIAKTLKESNTSHELAVGHYNANPKYCVVCGKPLKYEQRHYKTCSDTCYKYYLSQIAKENTNFGGITSGGGGIKSKKGYYKGIRCESSYELIYLVYCLENGIKIERNNKYFLYKNTKGETKKYYPDFYLPDSSTYVELKGYKDNNVDLKLEAVKEANIKINILYKADLIDKLDFINKRFNKNYHIEYADIAELYE